MTVTPAHHLVHTLRVATMLCTRAHEDLALYVPTDWPHARMLAFFVRKVNLLAVRSVVAPTTRAPCVVCASTSAVLSIVNPNPHTCNVKPAANPTPALSLHEDARAFPSSVSSKPLTKSINCLHHLQSHPPLMQRNAMVSYAKQQHTCLAVVTRRAWPTFLRAHAPSHSTITTKTQTDAS